ncbi:MAG: AraC family ligand binding domain-containing protein, partial [Planctomycetes bacterium]|nr:AraC family ligand binding domain-containing protein [Planctomycetota bacterium]
MDAPRLRLSRYAAPGGCCHVARSRIVTSLDRVHRHDFHELFWIEAGAGEQVVDGVRAPLGAGDLVLVRPEDAHGFAPAPGGLVMVNLALASAVAEEAVRRWCPGGGPWAGSPAQRRHRLAPAALRRLAAGAD